MNEALIFRQAEDADRGAILRIIAQAKAQMRTLGSRQWGEGYPAAADIEADLAAGQGRVLCLPTGDAIAYGAVLFDGEPAYAQIDGRWLTQGPYAVVHRLAVADGHKHRGVAREFLLRTEALARSRGTESMRIDTNFDNRYMLHLVERLGYAYCGRISYHSGERLAFEKAL